MSGNFPEIVLFVFPEEDIFHNFTHPCVDVESEHVNLPIARSDQGASAIFDIFAMDCSEKVLNKLKKSNICIVYIPAVCTTVRP